MIMKMAARCDTTANREVKSPGWQDRDLVERFRRGDQGAFEQIIAEHAPWITALAQRLLGWSDGAEDVTQEVFLAAYRKLASFRGQATLRTWLTTVTINQCRRHQSKRLAYLRLRHQTAQHKTQPQPDEPDTQQRRREQDTAVRQAVATLPPRYREVLVLHYLQGLEVAQVAQVLGINRKTVYVRLSRARKRLEDKLSTIWQDR